MATRLQVVAQALLDHNYDYDAGECMCGHRPRHPVHLVDHVADQILNALDTQKEA